MEESFLHRRLLRRLLFLTTIGLLIIGGIATIRPTLAQPTSLSVSPVEVTGIAIGGAFTIDLYVANVNMLNNWEAFLGYDTAVLDAQSVTWGPFNPTALMPYDIIDDAAGLVKMYYLGASGATVSGSGVIVTVGFTVTGYGESILDIGSWNSGGTVPHNWLINTASTKMTHDSYNGRFSNKLAGDADGDGDVDYSDFIILAGAYGSTLGQPAYKPNADFDQDGDVDYTDFIALAGNYGKSVWS